MDNLKLNKLKISYIRTIKNRLLFSVLSGMFLCVITLNPSTSQTSLAWWGLLYPQYCFMEIGEDSSAEYTNGQRISHKESVISNEESTNSTKDSVKISFWLAKVFDW